MSQKIEVGQTLYRLYRNRDNTIEIFEETVAKIGKKYLYLEGIRSNQFPVSIEDLTFTHKNYGQNNFKLYRTKQEIYDLQEAEYFARKFEPVFKWGNAHKVLTIEQIRAIAKILGIEYKEAI